MVLVTSGLWTLLTALLLVQVTGAHARQHVGQQLGLTLRNEINATDACAEAVATGLATTNVTWQTNGTIQYTELVAAIDLVFLSEPSCSPLLSNDSSGSVLLTWMQYPGWLNGAFTDWVWRMIGSGKLPHVLFSGPKQLPPPAAITNPADLRDYAVSYNNDVLIHSSDLSGFSASYTVEQRGVADYPENACLDKSVPRGPIHPRSYLLMFYRPDGLASLHAAGYTSSSNPPADWNATLGLLKAHAKAVRQAGNGGTSGDLGLPQHGLCLTTDVTCGRAGDLLAAIAASVLQYDGTQKGYVFDLSVAPPAASPLVNGASWRYAADVLRQLLAFNAGDGAEEYDTTEANGNGNVSYTRDCHTVSPWFTSGRCLMTFDWDATISAMGVPALQSPLGALAVAPLPGSRVVAAAPSSASASSSAAANASLVSCSSQLCAVSAHHDLLYLTSAGLHEAVLAAARGAAASCDSGSVTKMEAAAADAAVAAGITGDGKAAADSVVVNRAPYSVLYDYYIGNQPLALEMLQVPLGLASRLSSERLLRQKATNTIRRAVAATTTTTTATTTTTTTTNTLSSNATITTTSNSSNSSIPMGSAFMATPWWAAPFLIGGYNTSTSTTVNTASTTITSFPAEALSPYTSRGLDAPAAISYLRAVWHASHSPNLAPDVAAPAMVNWYKWALSHAAVLMLPPRSTTDTSNGISSSSSVGNTSSGFSSSSGVGVPAPAASVDEALGLLLRVWEQVNVAYTPAVVRSGYEAAIGAAKWQDTGQQEAVTGHSSSSLDTGALAAVVAGVVAGVALSGVLLLLLLRQRSRHRDLLGRVLAPRAGPDTTLLISDIQSSTTLWEQLPVPVMDLTLKLHHDTIRHLLLQYDGYESATEGDSFILAFPDPSRAVAFTAACQISLMLQEWPPELLLQPDAAPVLVVPQEGEAAQHAGMPGGDAWRHSGRPATRGSLLARIAAPAAYLSSRVRVAATLLRGVAVTSPLVTRGAADNATALRGIAFRSGHSGGGLSVVFRNASMFDMGFDMSQRNGPLMGGIRRSMELFTRSGAGPPPAPTGNQGAPVVPPAAAAPAESVMYRPRHSPFPSPHVIVPLNGGRSLAAAAAAAECKTPLSLDLPGSTTSPPHLPSTTMPTTNTGGSTTRPASPPAIPTKNVTFRGLPSSPCSQAAAAVAAAAATGTQSDVSPESPTQASIPTKLATCNRRVSVGGSDLPASGGAAPAAPPGAIVSGTRRDGFQSNVGVGLGLGIGIGGGGGGGGGVNGGCGGVDGSTTLSKLFTIREEHDPTRSLNGPASAVSTGPVCEWVLGPGGQWGAQLQLVFPVEEVPAAVMTGQELKSPWVMLPSGQLALLAFRGLRVRMGLHTGLDEPSHVTFNRVGSAYMYSGSFAELSKCASEAATGGLVVLSSQAFVRLRNTINSPGASGLPRGAPETVVVYAGHHMPKPKPPPPTLLALSPTTAAKALARAKQLQLSSPPPPDEQQPNEQQQDLMVAQAKRQPGQSRMSYSAVHVQFEGALHAPQKAAGGGVVNGNDTGRNGAEDDGSGGWGGGVGGNNGGGEGYAWYQAVPLTLACRLALSSPVVSARVLQLGTLAAPIGCICVAFMYVVGSSTLLADIPSPAARALDQFQRLVCSLLGARGGYLVEGGEGLVLAVFGSPSVAVEWALDCLARLKKLDWEDELLGHWLCEEVLSVGLAGADAIASLEPSVADSDVASPDPLTLTTVSATVTPHDSGTASPAGIGTAAGALSNYTATSRAASPDQGASRSRPSMRSRVPSPTLSAGSTRRQLRRGLSRMPSMARLGTMAATKRVLERGLRIKVGLDVGYATHSLNEASGRLSYRGKVMNRASRVAGKAAAGQVVCTDAVWRACLSAPPAPCEWEEDGDLDSEAGLGLVGVSLGKVALRGVSLPVELVQCMRG